MNVLLSSCTHWWNAEAHYAAVLCETLRAAGHGAWILTQPGTRHTAELAKRGMPTITDIPVWESNPLRWPRIVRELRALQERLAIDVVDVFRSREFLPHVLAARGTATALVRTRGSAQAVRGHAVNRWLYGAACDGVIASAEVLRKGLLTDLHLPLEHVRTIYYPAEPQAGPSISVTPEKWQREHDALCVELGWKPGRKMLCIVGRVFPEKGHAALVDAVAKLVREVEDAVLVIADKRYEDEAPYREALERRIAEKGLTDRVRWLGFREDVRRVMGCVDAGVIPSLSSEMNCRVAMEFFSVGTPVVAFPTGALPEVVEEGVSGLVIPDHTVTGLSGALSRILTDGALRQRLSVGASTAAATRFSREAFLRETLAAFEAAKAIHRTA